MHQAWAILWVQWRTMRNLLPRAGVAWTAIIGVVWYGMWTLGAYGVARAVADPKDPASTSAILPGGLLLVLLYWQLIPLLMAASGASLDLRKLLAYPIPANQFFTLEVLLRATAALEMCIIMAGLAVGLILNPNFPAWGVVSVAGFAGLNLLLAAGVRDVIERILARKGVRELAFFVLILMGALPQVLVRRMGSGDGPPGARLRFLAGMTTWIGWPWTAAAQLMTGTAVVRSAAILVAWMAAAGAFSRWQFSRTLRFDADAAGAGRGSKSGTRGVLEWFYGWPAALFRDPLGALVEKELRFLTRAPRFRLVFLMGFTFGLMVWLPLMLGRGGEMRNALGSTPLTVVSVYSMMLLGDVCFWNSFGFDRSAAQIYFLAPVDFARVLLAKNVSAAFFVLLEISLVAAMFTALRLSVGLRGLAEAYVVAVVAGLFLLAVGNLLSVHRPKGTDPSKSFRSGSAGRSQALLLLVYPVVFLPIGLAYLARYAFDTEAAFFAVLALDAGMGVVFYRISMESAVAAAGRLKEQIVAKLSEGVGPIAA